MIKKLEKQTFSFKIPIFETTVIVCVDDEVSHAVTEILKETQKTNYNLDAFSDPNLLRYIKENQSVCGFVYDIAGYSQLILLYLDYDAMNKDSRGETIEVTIVHEICHVVQHLCDNISINDKESFARIYEYIYDIILENLDEEYKQEKSERKSKVPKA